MKDRPHSVHENPWFSVTHLEDEDTGGGAGWFRVVRPDSAICIPIDSEENVIFIRGHRDTVGATARLELPSGAVDAGETPEQAAERETKEETGFLLTDLSPLGWFVESPGISSARCHAFVARADGHVDTSLEPGEEWHVERHPVREIRKLIANGEIRDGASLACLALFEAHSRQANVSK